LNRWSWAASSVLGARGRAIAAVYHIYDGCDVFAVSRS
jgi:hypothetical protein